MTLDPKLRLQLLVEGIWWLVTCLVVWAVLYPINEAFVQPFPFERNNIICIVLFITYTRYIFLLRHTLIAYNFWAKMVLVFATFPCMFFLVNTNFEFQKFVDEASPDGFLKLMVVSRPEIAHTQTIRYIYNEFVFFVVGSMIATLAMFFRMIVSIWRNRNSGDV